MLSTADASAVSAFFQLIGHEGTFAVGTLLGVVITYIAHRVASRDNVARMKIDLEREKELFRQLKAKDDRINALHGKIGELNAQLNRPSGG
jgi:hypothetical protein